MSGLPIQILVESLLQSLKESLLGLWEKIARYQEPVTNQHSAVTAWEESTGGRRRYIVPLERIEVLWSTGSWTAIANCLGISTKTLQRRREEYSLFVTFSEITVNRRRLVRLVGKLQRVYRITWELLTTTII